ncbi:hypothetical protein AX17_003133 [Amanita inopinata Kibby_2008]|nr:hypothetical protein AX17_003133 [Amanita inopinata Kibby_2008]
MDNANNSNESSAPENSSILAQREGSDMSLNWEELRAQSLRPGGFGMERENIWPKLLGVNVSERVKTPEPLEPGSEEKEEEGVNDTTANCDATSSIVEHQDERQIRLDTDRSFVLYPGESEASASKDTLKNGLNGLIVSVFRNRPKLSYFQGYHDIMTVLYLTLPPETQLACAEKLSLHRLRDSMLPSLEPVIGLLRVLKHLLRLADPEYAKLLERDSALPFHSLSNLLTLFSHDMPTLLLIQHVFDYLLCRPPIAVVYLAAAVLLARKDYIREMGEQLEPFMFHPILSTLPPLTGGYDAMQQTSLESAQDQENDTLAGTQNDVTSECHDTADQAISTVEVQVEGRRGTTPSPPSPPQNVAEIPSNESSENLSEPPHTTHDNASATPPDSTDPLALSPGSTGNLEVDENSLHPFSPSPSPSPLPSLSSLPSRSAFSSSILPSTAPSSLPETTPIPLPSLLSQADELYKLYPPSHPSLGLSSILGPQSVIFTWSESFAELPSDSTAEAMVGRPELVVYPFIPEDEEENNGEEGDQEGSSSEYGEKSRRNSRRGEKRGKGVRRRRKTLRKPKLRKILNMLNTIGGSARTGEEKGLTHVDGRTMVAGAVLVLGVAMAVYGVKVHGGLSESVAGLDRLSLLSALDVLRGRHGAHGHVHLHLHEELKKVGTMLAGVGVRFLHLGGDGLGGG